MSGEFSTVSIPPVKLEEKERRVNAMAILKLLCECPQLQRHLVELLSARLGGTLAHPLIYIVRGLEENMHWQFQTDNVFDILIFQNFHEYLLLYMLNTNYVFSFTSSLL